MHPYGFRVRCLTTQKVPRKRMRSAPESLQRPHESRGLQSPSVPDAFSGTSLPRLAVANVRLRPVW